MRSVAEWLVLPLFLLPVLAALGLGVWARDRHVRELARVRDGGAEIARRWLAEPDGQASWMRRHLVRDFAPGTPSRGEEADFVPFVHPTGPGEVHLPGSGLGRAPWLVADAYPAGLTPEALADPGVRLQIETGTRPAQIRGADPATTAFGRLLDAPDLMELRQAPLPPATKLFLVRRWRDAGADDTWLADAERLLGVLTAFDRYRVRGENGVDLPAGAYEMGEVTVLSGGGAWPVLLYPDTGVLPRTVLAERGAEDVPVDLVWIFPPQRHLPKGVVWDGRLEEPLAGRWLFASKYAHRWWRTPRVKRWAGPAAVLLVSFLVLPVALFVSLRRKRRREEARVRFLNELAHDLRTPLTSLRLHADLLARGRAGPEKRERYVATVTREAARLSGLLANVLDLSRLETGKRSIELVAVRVQDAVDHAVAEFLAVHADREGDVRRDGPIETAALVDPTALGRCLANLLDNAGKFTAPGTPIRVTWRRDGETVLLVVADEGRGIPPDEAPRIFDRYVRGRRPASDGVPGTGLGLSLVRDLVREMGGSVRLLSSAKGAVFELRLRGTADA